MTDDELVVEAAAGSIVLTFRFDDPPDPTPEQPVTRTTDDSRVDPEPAQSALGE